MMRWPGLGARATIRAVMYRENRWIGKANLDWQADRYNRIKLGGEFTHYDIESYTHQLDEPGLLRRLSEKPIRWNAFAEDRLDLGDVVVVGGLRYDWYRHPGTPPRFPRDRRPTRCDPTIRHAVLQPTRPPVPRGQEPQLPEPAHPGVLPGDRPDQLPALLRAPGAGARTSALVLRRHQHRLDLTNTNHVFGSDLDFGKTITFEFGIRHAFSDDMVLDVAAYNKDNLSDPAARLVALFDPATGVNTTSGILTNARLRQHPRPRRAARPAVRQLLQRHVSYSLPAGQEHRLRSVHLHRTSARGS